LFLSFFEIELHLGVCLLDGKESCERKRKIKRKDLKIEIENLAYLF
jgi:hypothetical protein